MEAFDDRSTRCGRARGARRGGARDRLYRRRGRPRRRQRKRENRRSEVTVKKRSAVVAVGRTFRADRRRRQMTGAAARGWSVRKKGAEDSRVGSGPCVLRRASLESFGSSNSPPPRARARDARWTIDQTQERCSRSQPYARARSASKAARLESTLRNAPIELSPPTIDGEGATGAPSPPNKVAARSSVYSSEMTPFSDT